VLGGGDRFLILPMGQVVAWPTVSIAEPLHRAVDRGRANADAQAMRQDFAQIADAPNRASACRTSPSRWPASP
jgi:hypothetical protein